MNLGLYLKIIIRAGSCRNKRLSFLDSFSLNNLYNLHMKIKQHPSRALLLCILSRDVMRFEGRLTFSVWQACFHSTMICFIYHFTENLIGGRGADLINKFNNSHTLQNKNALLRLIKFGGVPRPPVPQ